MNISAHLVLGLVVLGLGVAAPPAKAQSFIRTIGSSGHGDGQLSLPFSVAVDTANGSNMVVADTFNNRVEVFTSGNPLAPVPALGIWGLLLSALLLAGIGYHATRRSAA